MLRHADPAMTQRKYMARGRVHHDAAVVIHSAVMGGLGHREQDSDGAGQISTFERLSGAIRGLETNSAPDRVR
ncbi:hypothetical protein [Nocardia sp. bgisy134]|uniref:hypothetical protein n=1 Tax=unclassified Nocardia TaxID=2637762 RepID=UPI003D7499DD